MKTSLYLSLSNKGLIAIAFAVAPILALFAMLSLFLLGNDALAYSTLPSVELASPVLKTYSQPLMDITAGQQVIIATTVTNSFSDKDLALVVLIEARDSDGMTQYLAWQSGEVKVGSQIEVGVSWIPEHGDSYEIRAFAITNDWEKPQMLSPPAKSGDIIIREPDVNKTSEEIAMEEIVIRHVLREFAGSNTFLPVEAEYVNVIKSEFISIYSHSLFDVHMQINSRVQSNHVHFYYNPRTGEVYDYSPPDFERITGITNLDRELRDALVTAGEGDEVNVLLSLQRLPEDDEPKRISILQKVIRQVQDIDNGRNVIHVNGYSGVPDDTWIAVSAKVPDVYELLRLPNVSHANLDAIASI